MTLRIEDYAAVGDTHTMALVGRNGSVDWLCMPRFDSPACFAALLGDARNGCWKIAPAGEVRFTRRRYRDASLILETDFECDGGAVTLIDFMPLGASHEQNDLVRMVKGVRGTVRMRCDLTVRFEYGRIVPWVRDIDGATLMVAGPDALMIKTPIALRRHDARLEAEFTVSEGQVVPFHLAYFLSYEAPTPLGDAAQLLAETEQWWRDWSRRCSYDGPWREAVVRSLVTLKAMTYRRTGGIVAAPTTSLPERIGGVRNWDYRYCWLRDATFLLYAFRISGYVEEAIAWRGWLLRAIGGAPEQIQIMYGICGERRLDEIELPWLDGYAGSKPVRIGNAAHTQLQLDVYGEVMDAFHLHRSCGGDDADGDAWTLQQRLLDVLERDWKKPDNGIWEVRGPRRHFTHSKMMAWVAADRAVKTVERFGGEGDVARWRRLRDTIHREVCAQGFNTARGAFTQYFGSDELDASLLLMPQVGFLPATDPRVAGTIAAVARELTHDGFVMRYRTGTEVDPLPPGEGVFLPCSFWLADALCLLGKKEEARRLFERLLALANDVGLMSEEYDPRERRLLGNFPQALTHVAVINTAHNLSGREGPASHRARCSPDGVPVRAG